MTRIRVNVQAEPPRFTRPGRGDRRRDDRTPTRTRAARTLHRALLPLALALCCLTQAGCLNAYLADRLIAPPNGGGKEGIETLTAPGFLNGGGSLPVGPPERPATIVHWVVEPGPFAVEVVPDGQARSPLDDAVEAIDAPRGQRWVVIRCSHPRLPRDLVLRRPVGDAGPQQLGEREAVATVFLLQGWGSRQRTLPYLWHVAGWLADAGCRVVMPDLRGQGDSSGDALTFGYLERRDLAALADDLEARGLIDGPLGVIGHSYGGGTAIQWAAVDPRVRRVLALSPYADGQSAGETVRALLADTAPVRAFFLNPILSDARFAAVGERVQRELGYDLAGASPLASMPRVAAPVLLVHGTQDRNVPFSNARRLRAARPAGTRLIPVEGAGHFRFLLERDAELKVWVLGWLQGLLTGQP